jgi:hypothetical protein
MFRLVLLISILLPIAALSQQLTIRGKLIDTLSTQPVPGATITILSREDSSLVSFTMTSAKGEFAFSGIGKGNYRLLVTHVNYHNVSRNFDISQDKDQHDFGTIPLGDKYKTMNEIIVQAEAPPVTIIQDTIEYNAGSFKTQPNANVEDMLKKLPGVKVEKDGTVKAQGQKVNRVFVDGKEFFGNDPKIATRNLPADAVDKVQVYDHMSDQARITGFDDGNSEKAINLKLKKDKKKGLFGKASAGIGTDNRYEGRFNVNSFKNERQLSAIGMANNDNADGFSFLDILNFNGDLSRMQQSGGGEMRISISSDDPSAAMMVMANNTGINSSQAGGLNYNDLLGKKTDLRSNYFFNRYNPYIEKVLERQYLLPDSVYFYNQRSVADNINTGHRFNVSLEHRFDSLTSVKISPSLSLQNTQVRSATSYETLSGAKMLTNNGFSLIESDANGYAFRNDILFRKKFARKGRTFSLNLQQLLNGSDGNGLQESINSFYESNGSLYRKDSINQSNLTSSTLHGYSARAVYTEPLGKRLLMEFSTGRSSTKTSSLRNTFDYSSQSGKFDELNPLLSNDYDNTYSYTNAGAKLRYQKKKFNIAFGAQWQEASLKGNILTNGKDTSLQQKFYNILPNARFQYNFNRFRNITFNYYTITNQPTISQLQPVPDISNPVNIRIGNPKLDQEFTHIMQLNYMSVDPFKGTNFFAFLNYRGTGSRIVNSDSISPFGIKYTIPVNVDGVYSVSGDINWGLPLKFIKKSTLNFGINMIKSKDIQFVNRDRNNINSVQLRPEIRVENNSSEKVNTGVSYSNVIYNTRYSLQPALDTRYFTHEIGTFVNWQLPLKFYFATDFTYTINTKRAEGYNANVPLWNASVSKQFLKYNRGEFKLRVYDILNQNVGINRSSNNNYIEDSRTTILRRFLMLSFTYSLSKSGLGTEKGGTMIKVMR